MTRFFAIRSTAFFLSAGLLALRLAADPLTKDVEIDFGRDVASRELKGLATRSDGRILPGPVFTDLAGPKIGDILWALTPAGKNRFLVGTGPDGKVQEVTFKPADQTYTVREVADVAETQAIAVLPLPKGQLLIGTSPTAAIYLVDAEGKNVARVPLPADSVFDFLSLADGSVLAAAGNPGKIYRLDLAKLAKAGLIEGKAGDEKLLVEQGITLFGEIRDRNVRRLAQLADGRVIAGSSPKGNVYSFPSTGGDPQVLQENRDAEVVDFLPAEDGGFYAGIVSTPGDSNRISRTESKTDAKEKEEPKPAFAGRSTVVRFPLNGFPETIAARSGVALYRLGRHANWLIMTAGELGDAFGYDPAARRSLTFAGSSSAQLNDLAPLGDGQFLVLRNNAPGLALMSFSAAPARTLETKRIDLGQASELGGLRFSRLRNVAPADLKIQVRANNGSDELEGWTPWADMTLRDGAYYAENIRGRYAKFRLTLNGVTSDDFQIDKATLYHLPQNRRPTLTDFRILSPNAAMIAAPEPVQSVSTTLSSIIFPSSRDKDEPGSERRKSAIMNSQVVPQLGQQIIYWSVNDLDGDNLAYTFSIRPESGTEWSDLAVDVTQNYVQFDTSNLPEGLHLTRLTVMEQAPRPAAERLTYAFETDNLMIDRTPPKILSTEIERADGKLFITVEGSDALSPVEGAEFILNNGQSETVTHPVDGILDGQRETFVAEISEARAAGATSVEVVFYDRATNSSSIRLPLK